MDHRVVSLEIPDNVSRQEEKSDDKHEAKLDIRTGKRAEIPSNREVTLRFDRRVLTLRAGHAQA